MTAATQTLKHPSPASHLRPIDLRRDLKNVANLVELCFAETLDQDGRRYVRQMRAAALPGYRGTFAQGMSGWVWEDEGKLVGNLNMIPVYALRQRAYLIANVAVHPDYRRQGIAQTLTDTALDHIRQRGVRSVWLQVNTKNHGAIQLYTKAGFLERAQRTTWHSLSHFNDAFTPSRGVTLENRHHRDWPLQRTWLRQTYPGEVKWHLPINLNILRPGLSGMVNRMVNERKIDQWSAYLDKQLIGSVAWQSSYAQADWLWLAVSSSHQDLAVEHLLLHARRKLKSTHRTLAVNYPAGQAMDAFAAAGFAEHNTLIWMHSQLQKKGDENGH
jgi:GNAT superfamily N-acetyltransferase